MLSGSNSNLNVAVYDITGRLLQVSNDMVYGSSPVFGSNYAPGVYVVEVRQGELKRSVRVVKRE